MHTPYHSRFLDLSPSIKTQSWRYVLTIVITIMTFAIAHAPLLGIVQIYATRTGLSPDRVDQALAQGGLTQLGVGANLAFAAMLFPFAAALVATLICVRFLHRQPIRSLLTGRARFDGRRVGVAALIWAALAGTAILVILPDDQVIYQFHAPTFLSFLWIALLLIPLQIAAEEILFRGVLLQWLGRFWRRPIWPLAITTGLFAAVHLTNPEFQIGFWSVIPAYLGLSLFLGGLALADDGLELPIGVHLGNNLFTALILSTHDGAMVTPSVLQTNAAAVIHSFWVILLTIPLATFCLHLAFPLEWRRMIEKRPEAQLG